ncbi:NADPH-dependent FMN reductase [Paraburkholderia sp. ZP32-5]|uniref:NADPH-dependent FMN reductase n=1 Tax=Paraburkholderia sp. ZP32-5 TaxID=2883245 RepID=UPI001F23166D|nr:NAD(P)H-dependent oxidoreductase [Paraburkholderia sp. ZP32-5]
MSETTPLRIVGIGGTTRAGSSCETALRIALQAAGKAGAQTEIIAGDDLVLPMYSPENRVEDARSERLVKLLREADGVIIASPGYHGSLSGLVKNALDYTEDMRTDNRPYFEGRAVGSIVCAAGWQAVGTTLTTLRSIIHALRGWPTPVGAGINTATKQFDQGEAIDPAVAAQLRLVAQQVVEFARMRVANSTAG